MEIFNEAYNTSKNFTIGESNLHRTTIKNNNRKIKILNYSQHDSISSEFPLLCILSEEKKKHSKANKNLILKKQEIKAASSLPHQAKTYVQN